MTGPRPRATWVWDRPEPGALVAFLVEQGVGEAFVSTPGDRTPSPDLAWFREVRARATGAGIRLAALGAEVAWLDDPAAALAWQRKALDTGLFDGVHVDVEPWLHPGWVPDRGPLLGRYLELLGALRSAATVPLEADISFWLDQHSVGGERVDEAVLARVDAVTVMSYRTTVCGPDSVTGVGGPALEAAARAGKPARLAVETRELGAAPGQRKQTFHGSSRGRLAEALAAVDTAGAGAPAYAGVAVHDVTGWRALPPS